MGCGLAVSEQALSRDEEGPSCRSSGTRMSGVRVRKRNGAGRGAARRGGVVPALVCSCCVGELASRRERHGSRREVRPRWGGSTERAFCLFCRKCTLNLSHERARWRPSSAPPASEGHRTYVRSVRHKQTSGAGYKRMVASRLTLSLPPSLLTYLITCLRAFGVSSCVPGFRPLR